MKKYKELQEQYQEEIAYIKVIEAEHDTMIAQAEAINPIVHPEPDFEEIARQEGLFKLAHDKYCDYMVAFENLHNGIEAEYHSVPFARVREQGIKKFYELAGLKA